MSEPVKVASEQIDPVYQVYLAQLNLRNKQRLLIQKKSKEQERRERLEQGFTLYFNLPSPSTSPSGRRKLDTNRPSETARGVNPYLADVPQIKQPFDPFLRSRSAPAYKKCLQRRRAWTDSSDLLTNGPRVCLRKSTRKRDMVKDPQIPAIGSTTFRSQSAVRYDKDKTKKQLKRGSNTTRNSVHESGMGDLYSEIPTHLEVYLDIYDNWGDDQHVGLNGLQLIFEGFAATPFNVIDVSCFSLDVGESAKVEELSISDVSQLVSEPFQTTKKSNMWHTNVKHLPLRLSFTFVRPDRVFPVALSQPAFSVNIWNYNDPLDLQVGVKQCRVIIYLHGMEFTIFEGIVKQATGNERPKQLTKLPFRTPDLRSAQPVNDVHGEIPDLNELNRKVKSAQVSSRTRSELQPKKNLSMPPRMDKYKTNEVGTTSYVVPAPLSSRSTKKPTMIENGLNPINPEQKKGKKLTNKGPFPMDSFLEDSWTSLDFFNHCHAGRLAREKNMSKQDGISRETTKKLSGGKLTSSLTKNGDTEMGLTRDELQKVPEIHENLLQKGFMDGGKIPLRPSNEEICIPELPRGQVLLLDIVNTWGDLYYVGLSGIEIFTSDGLNVAPLCDISADPPNINILPEYENDPRIVQNLIDGVNWTRDDVHMWLTPFTVGGRHLVRLVLPPGADPLAMMRIWNYNKSRVHTFRGVRELIIYLDDCLIFHGEIRRASGLESGEPEDFSETILFTTDDEILERVALNDCILTSCGQQSANGALTDDDVTLTEDDTRPITAVPQKSEEAPIKEPELEGAYDMSSSTRGKNDEGKSSSNNNKSGNNGRKYNEATNKPKKNVTNSTKNAFSITESKSSTRIRWVEITLLENWNRNIDQIGLTGISILKSDQSVIRMQKITLNGKVITAEDPAHCLFDNVNETDDANHMWVSKFERDIPIKFRFYLATKDSGVRDLVHSVQIWNYNDINGDLGCGVRLMRITDNNGRILAHTRGSEHILVRRAPGHLDYPFVQTILLENTHNKMVGLSADQPTAYEDSSVLPCGFVYQIDIFSTWEDRYYVGLDGLELLDENGATIPIEPSSVFANPGSVREVLGDRSVRADVRTADKLVDGYTSGPELSRHCWLAPILPNQSNRIFIIFNEPITSSALKLWNYSRTPERGVREMAVLVDNQLIFRGYLPKVDDTSLRSVSKESEIRWLQRRLGRRSVCEVISDTSLRKIPPQSHYYLVPFDYDTVRKYENDTQFILGDESTDSREGRPPINDEPKLVDVRVWERCLMNKPQLFTRNRSVSVNQALRPYTCITCRR
ncbi:unnamed protein product [Calicophoron daubneyi]|uniref:KATNIP domain-containing protein n=1 Tax=Calicophoron daubneyi TaxID=300641 RepID=A0AAV2TRA5_CALDB